ncbi:hypothetical protein GGR52DRAFT_583349 [Hypoxylon sp. FL1284]|nr:hypothetical protein GGR52DRAFT_583349 [Hypoxylon sp. FL1284]
MTTPRGPATAAAGNPRPCNRCKERDAAIDLRGAEKVCESCFAYYVTTKAVKRLEVLQREATAAGRGKPGKNDSGQNRKRRPQRYLLALSCGPSSTALLHVLTENARQQRQKQRAARFEYVVVHVYDDSLVSPPASSSTTGAATDDVTAAPSEPPILATYRALFPSAPVLAVPLSAALSLPAVALEAAVFPDASSTPSNLPPTSSSTLPPSTRLANLLAHLPSATSRADARRLLTRHVLAAAAVARRCDAVLLGHSATSLAELTLGEAARGRGGAVPWLVGDGPFSSFSSFPPSSAECGWGRDLFAGDDEKNDDEEDKEERGDPEPLFVYSPLRELFRGELRTYLTRVAGPAVADLCLPHPHSSWPGAAGAVVSHRDQSIDDVLSRYFGEVEASYPSVVANVVRTAGKLLRHQGDDDGDGDKVCGLCGLGLDELGDERWRGEIGDETRRDEAGTGAGAEGAEGREKKPVRLCYGCERSLRG